MVYISLLVLFTEYSKLIIVFQVIFFMFLILVNYNNPGSL